MTDLLLRADTETDLAAALPFMREDVDGLTVWRAVHGDGASATLDIIGPLATDARFHANMRCTPAIAALVPGAIVVAPDPATPTRRFA